MKSIDTSLLSTLPPLPTRHRTIAFTSGKGGVGKSNVVLNTGILLARAGRRVAILDGDFGLASVNVLLGVAPRWDLRHVLTGERRLSEIVVRGPHGLLVIPAGSGVAELANLTQDEREVVLSQLDEVGADVHFLLIDTGAGINDTVLNLVVASDEAVVVTRPEPTALADAYALMKVVVRDLPTYPFHVLINMAHSATQARQVFDSLQQILNRFLGYQPGDAGWIVADPAVGRAVVQQTPFTVMAPDCPAAQAVGQLVDRLVGTAREPRATTPFWQRLAGWARAK